VVHDESRREARREVSKTAADDEQVSPLLSGWEAGIGKEARQADWKLADCCSSQHLRWTVSEARRAADGSVGRLLRQGLPVVPPMAVERRKERLRPWLGRVGRGCPT
jgi:hypothetical protein